MFCIQTMQTRSSEPFSSNCGRPTSGLVARRQVKTLNRKFRFYNKYNSI